MDTPASASSSAIPVQYDLFLSYRSAEDVGNFNRFLYSFGCFNRKSSSQDQKLQEGDDNSSALLRQIQSSNLSIIIFSNDYSSSPQCLDELVHILQCRELNGLIVLPIFYRISPSDVRKQTGTFGTAFSHLEERFRDRMSKVTAWRAALKVASNLCGWNTVDTRMQSDLLAKIISDMEEKIYTSKYEIYISIYPLRFDVFHEYLKVFLQVGVDNVLLLGIAGEAKMGKTVIAKAMYDGIFQAFEGSSFLRDVGKRSGEPNGIVQLQEKLLFDLLGDRMKVTSLARGVDVIQEKLRHKRVLIVLDDVDNLSQLFALVGSREWFGLGSKIIVTSRNLPLLRIFGVDQLFTAQGLPMPFDIQEIWEPYQQSFHKIAGLQQYIRGCSYLSNDNVEYLEECLIKERRKGAIQKQKICELQQASNSCTLLAEVGTTSRDAISSSMLESSPKSLSESVPGDIDSVIQAEVSFGVSSTPPALATNRTMIISPQPRKKGLTNSSASK